MRVRNHALLLGALVVGAIAVADPQGWSPFGPSKWLVVSTLGLLGGGIAVFRNPGGAGDRRTWRAWAALVTLLGIAALVGGDVPTALLGHPDRHLGLVTWLLCWLLFTAGERLRPIDGGVVALGAVVASGWTATWCLWELVVGRPIELDSTSERLTGPLGSAAFLGAAVCLLLPICVGVALDPDRRRAWRVAAGLGAIGDLLALIGSGTRAAWLGTVVAALVLIVARRPSRRALILGVLAIGLAVAVVSPRLADVASRDHGSASRLDEWRVAARVIADHPFVGVGPEGYRLAVATGIDVEYERAHPREAVLPDRAHSGPLDVALAGGVGAAMAYLALLGMVAVAAWRVLRRRGPTDTIGVAVGVVAYGAQQWLLFPTAELDPVWWMCCGIVVGAVRRPIGAGSGDDATFDDEGASVGTGPGRRRVTALVGAVTALLAPIALVAGVLDVAADRLALDSLHALASGDDDLAVSDARRAVDLRPDSVRYRLVVATALERRGSLLDLDRALEQVHAAAHWSPDDPLVLGQQAELLSRRAQVTGESDDESRAVAAWTTLVAGDPHRADWQLALGRAAVLTGDVDLARAAWTAAATLSPTDPTATDLLTELDRRS